MATDMTVTSGPLPIPDANADPTGIGKSEENASGQGSRG
jgi:hypothetical protein